MSCHHRSRSSRYLMLVANAVFVAALCWPSTAWACQWIHRNLANRFEQSTDVFIARVVESPLMRGTGVKASGQERAWVAKLAIEIRYKQADFSEVMVPVGGGGDCLFPFVEGERYLIFGTIRNGQLNADASSEPLLIGGNGDAHEKQQAALAVQYAEGRAAGRPVALVEGLLRLSLSAPSVDQVRVRADGTVRSESGLVKVDVDLYLYGLVLPPGDYELAGVRAGVRITDVTSIRLSDRQGTKLEPLTVGARSGNRVK